MPERSEEGHLGFLVAKIPIPGQPPCRETSEAGLPIPALQQENLTVPERGSMTAFESPAPPGRLAYDAELSDRLRAAGCQGNEWEVFAAALYKRAVKTTYRWIVEGAIFLQCRKRNRTVAPGDVGEWSENDLRALARETVEDNFTLFKGKGILGGDWDPDKGASLFTYFMNGVVLSFPNVFRRFERSRRQRRRVDLHDNLDRLDQADTSDYSTSLSRCAAVLKELLDAIPTAEQRRVAELFLIDCLGFNQIAQRLGTTEAAARSSWNRAKLAMQRKYLSVEGGGP
jgi:hypothetical protein